MASSLIQVAKVKVQTLGFIMNIWIQQPVLPRSSTAALVADATVSAMAVVSGEAMRAKRLCAAKASSVVMNVITTVHNFGELAPIATAAIHQSLR